MARDDRKSKDAIPVPRPTPVRTLRAQDIERIRELAYACYSARLGGGPGDAMSDWLEAERMFLAAATPNTETASSKPPVTQAKPLRTEANLPHGQRKEEAVTA